MKIGFGCDHAAIDLKNELIEYMTEKGYECVDYGTAVVYLTFTICCTFRHLSDFYYLLYIPPSI